MVEKNLPTEQKGRFHGHSCYICGAKAKGKKRIGGKNRHVCKRHSGSNTNIIDE